MMYENKKWERNGLSFNTKRASFDLSAVRFLHAGVDTLKQLYNCCIREGVLQTIDGHLSSSSGPLILGGIPWAVSKSSKVSGYQYILKNLEEGLVVLLKSYYLESEQCGSHLKIEVSPDLIERTTPHSLDMQLENVAKVFGSSLKRSGIAVHICLDFKGFDIPEDFEKRLVTRARRNFRYNKISNVEFDGVNEVAVVHGSGQSYTFGSAGGLQMCIYDKTAQIQKIDKVGFWENVWREVPSAEDPLLPEYNSGDKVQRLEFRFHHSIVQEFCYGTGVVIDCFSDLQFHLTAFWRYALNNYRLMHSTTYIDPLWQLFMEDVQIYMPPLAIDYKRAQKEPSVSSRRNVAMWLGNAIKLHSRRGFSSDYTVNHIIQSGLDDDLFDYFKVLTRDKNVLRYRLREFVSEKMVNYQLCGVAA